jgi:hypothetical protein
MAQENQTENDSLKPVAGLFRDGASAESAFGTLLNLDYDRDEISVVMTDETRSRHYPKDTPLDASSETAGETRAVEGAAIMGSVGGVLGALAAIGVSIAVPGAGFIIIGPLAAAGAGLGATAGGLIGALLGSSVPKEEIEHYEHGLRAGGILIRFNPRSEDEAQRIVSDWEKLGARVRRY